MGAGLRRLRKPCTRLCPCWPPVRAAADTLARGARAVEEWDVEAAMTLLYDAIDIYEAEGKEANASDVFRSVRRHSASP